MSHTSRTSRRASILGAGLGLLTLVATACAPAADHTGAEGVDPAPVAVEPELVNDPPANWPRLLNDVCEFDPRYLPRTPDAVEAWYRSCRTPY